MDMFNEVVKMKVALFGGTFNPSTKGHIKIARTVLDQNLIDRVWFVPNDKHLFRDSISHMNCVNGKIQKGY